MHSPPCSRMACASADALAAVRVVSTVKKPSWANFCATAPPTPQRTPTGRSLSSSVLPCASKVLRPSDCHLEVAPTTTQTCLSLVFVLRFSLIANPLPFAFRDSPPPLPLRHLGRPLSLEHLADRGRDPLAVWEHVIFKDGAVGYWHLQRADSLH